MTISQGGPKPGENLQSSTLNVQLVSHLAQFAQVRSCSVSVTHLMNADCIEWTKSVMSTLRLSVQEIIMAQNLTAIKYGRLDSCVDHA